MNVHVKTLYTYDYLTSQTLYTYDYTYDSFHYVYYIAE